MTIYRCLLSSAKDGESGEGMVRWAEPLCGIYRFEGDHLRIAYREGRPPENFESPPGSKITVFVMQRADNAQKAGPFGPAAAPEEAMTAAAAGSRPPTVTVSRPTVLWAADHLEFTGSVEAGKPLRITFQVDEHSFLQLRQEALKLSGGKALKPDWALNIPIAYILANEPRSRHQTRLRSADAVFDRQTGTARWIADLAKDDKARMSECPSACGCSPAPRTRRCWFRNTRLGVDQGKRYVLTVNERNVLQARPVSVGDREGDLRFISGGLTVDDWLVVSDLHGLRAGMTVKPAFGKGMPDRSPAMLARRAAAEQFVDLLKLGEFQKATERFDDTMKELVPPAELQKMWEQLKRTGGKPLWKQPGRTGGKVPGGEQSPTLGTISPGIEFVPVAWEHKDIDIKVVFEEQGKISGLWTVWPEMSVMSPGKAARPSNSPFAAPLPNGVTVELLGVAESPANDRPWWRPDGAPLDGRPYDRLDDAMVAGQGQIVRELAVRLDHLPAEPVSTLWWVVGGWRDDAGWPVNAGYGWRENRPLRPGIPVEKLEAVSVVVPEAAETLTVRIGLAAGPWATIAQRDAGPHAQIIAGGGLRMVTSARSRRPTAASSSMSPAP